MCFASELVIEQAGVAALHSDPRAAYDEKGSPKRRAQQLLIPDEGPHYGSRASPAKEPLRVSHFAREALLDDPMLSCIQRFWQAVEFYHPLQMCGSTPLVSL